MNLATGSLVFVGFIFLVVGIASKLIGISLLHPLFTGPANYMTAANSCFLIALVVHKFQKS